MRSKKAHHKKMLAKRNRFFLIGLIFLACILLGISAIKLFLPQKPLENEFLETPKNEMHKIPADVTKQMQEAKKTPSLLATERVPILMYHYVEYVQDKGDKIRQSLDVTPDVFESQVMTLREAGYTFMTAKELGDVLDGKATLPDKPILLTFDDGHWDFNTVVLPILEKYQAKATAYIISGFLGGSDFMTTQEVQDIINSGLVDVGAHTIHHVSLKGLPLSVVTNELTQSKAYLEDTFHIHVVSFAYPFGSFDQQAIDAVKQAGYTTAVSTIPGIQQSQVNRYFLYRLRPGYRTGDSLLSFLQQNTFSAY